MTAFAVTGALVDAVTGRRLAGRALASALAPMRAAYEKLPVGPVFARTARDLDSVLRYLAALAAGRCVALLDPGLPAAALAEVVGRFQPAAVVGLEERAQRTGGRPPPGYVEGLLPAVGGSWQRRFSTDAAPHPDLALLLPTSGSTGSPKFVRLSRRAVGSNAAAIVAALGLGPNETAPTSLPLFYSYGLSVLNSHLLAGATVLVTGDGIHTRDFWRACDTHEATSLAGVPQHYETLARMRWSPANRPRLRALTQAGGRMRPELIERLHQQMAAAGGRLYVMYGQTEATARITVLPPDRLVEKIGSVGLPIPGGTLRIRGGEGTRGAARPDTGEVLFRGPGVMMGYATGAADLARGDESGGELATGDLGYLDAEGFLYITGRVKRIGKVFGVRVDLDDLERVASADTAPVAAVAAGDQVVVCCLRLGADQTAGLARRLADRLRLPRAGIDVRLVDAFPTLPSGKIDYARLAAEVTDDG